MFLYVLLLFSLSRSFAFPSTKIVNGSNAEEGEIPYIISLRVNGRHSCGGSILNENHVLTASHCVFGMSPFLFSVQYGVLQISSTDNIIPVEKITTHPNYMSGGGWINDLAILKLESPITFSDTVRPVTLPSQNDEVKIWSIAVLAGWGYPYTEGNYMDHLQRVDILVFPDDDCETIHSGLASTLYHICAGVLEGGKGQCSGDSGSPLTVNDVQVGLVSWSVKPCAIAGYPGVFTRITNYITWIDEEMQL